jgi:hypothetical protein
LAPLDALHLNLDRQARIARARQAAGELSKVELTAALLDANRNTLSLLEARTRTEVALAALDDATQSPLQPAQLWSNTLNVRRSTQSTAPAVAPAPAPAPSHE